MKKVLTMLVLAAVLLGCCLAAAEDTASIVAAMPVTQVLESGETVAGIRLEFSEEVPVLNVGCSSRCGKQREPKSGQRKNCPAT